MKCVADHCKSDVSSRLSFLIRETLGDHIFDRFIKNKKVEWDRFRTHVSQYEIERYLPLL